MCPLTLQKQHCLRKGALALESQISVGGVLTLPLLLAWPHILFLNPLYLSFLKCKIEMRILHNVDMNMK